MLALVLGVCAVIVYHLLNPVVSLAAAGIYFALGSLLLRVILASTSTPAEDPEGLADDLFLGLVVPFYNEDPTYFSLCLESISDQSRPPGTVWLIDDASSSNECYEYALEWAKRQTFEVHVHQLTVNVGKRHGQAIAFYNQTVDVWMTCDSDTMFDNDAIAEGLKPFADPRVHGVAGLTMGYNWKKNVLTRIIDIEFVNSFLIGRACLSRFGAVLVSCGTIAFYRGSVVMKNIDDYLNETFMGSPVRAGDDRKLTQYCLLEGRMVYQESSVAYTALPERLNHLIRQRIRWSASFYRAILWTAQNLPKNRLAFWMIFWQAVELVSFLLVFVAFILHITSVLLPAMIVYFGYMAVISYVRSIRYLTVPRPDMSMKDRLLSVAISPLISILYTFILTPVRYYSVLRSKENKWGTRQQVEVSAEPDSDTLISRL